MRQKLAAGNWKMHGVSNSLSEVTALAEAMGAPTSEVLICPPATLLAPLTGHIADLTAPIATGGQDCHAEVAGAHTGDIAAAMLADAGARYVILGHSERRADHGEQDAEVAAKAQTAWAAGLVAIICVGETLAQREAGETLAILDAQLAGSVPNGADGARVVIAYEPVWAIGTGKVATTTEIAEAHAHIRARLVEHLGAAAGGGIRVLYGGSVKPGNAAEIFAVPNVDGSLVGGASLKAADFAPIVAALDAS